MQYNRLNNPNALIDLIKALDRRVSNVETRGTGPIGFVGEDGVELHIGVQPDGEAAIVPFVGDTTPPPVATAPTAVPGPGFISVTWDGLFVDLADKPRDFDNLNVIGHKVVGGVVVQNIAAGIIRNPLDSCLVGTDVMPVGDTWEFSFVSEDYNGNLSAFSLPSAVVEQKSFAADVLIEEALEGLEQDFISAQNAAASAQQAADAAQDAADEAALILTSKGAIYSQSETPDADPNGLWIDTGHSNVPRRYLGTGNALFVNVGGGASAGARLTALGWTITTVTSMPTLEDASEYDLVAFDAGYAGLSSAYGTLASSLLDKGVSVFTSGNDTTNLSPLFTGGPSRGTPKNTIRPVGTHEAATGWAEYSDGDLNYYLTGVKSDAVVTGVTLVTSLGTDQPLNIVWEHPTTFARWAHVQTYATPASVLDAHMNWIADNWIAIQDQSVVAAIAAAQLKADQAFNNAATAAAAAGNAQTSADSKNTVWYQDDAPAGTSHKVGDTWFDKNNGYKVYTWTGTIWQATQDSALAQQTADAKGRVYTQNTAPPVEARLPQNLWIDTSAGAGLYVTKYWNGSIWTTVKDADAAAAQTTADSKGETIYSSTEPAAAKRLPQNLWVDTTGGLNINKRWDGNAWIVVVDSRIPSTAAAVTAVDAAVTAVETRVDDVEIVAESKGEIIYSTSAPTVEQRLPQNLWIDTNAGVNIPKRWNGSAWVAVTDKTATDAAAAASAAQSTANTAVTNAATAQGTANTALTSANGKNKIYYQTSMPTGGTYIAGDTWFDTDDGNKIYVHNGTTFVDAQDTDIAAAQSTATTANTTANSALTTANSKTKTYFQTAQPGTSGNTTGDIWFDTDDGNKVYVWNGSAWTTARDTGIAAAQTSADGKNTIFYQTASPSTSGRVTGDTWFDTDDGNKIYVWNGSAWTASQDAAIAAAQTTANTKTKTFIQGSAPTATTVGDIWIDTANGNVIKTWEGSSWVTRADAAIATAQSTANSAQTSANGKNKIYYQTAQPSGGTYITGDTWFDTDDGNKIYVYNGSTWVASQDASIATAQTAANNAQTTANTANTTANSKTKTFIQGTAPTATTVGDIWIDTANGNVIKTWEGSSWVTRADAAIASAQGTANTALTSANGKNKTYYQTAMPTGGTYILGDTWFDTDDGNKIYVHNGTTFVASQDASIATAQTTANTANTTANSALTTANSKTKTYFQTAQPGTSGNTTGDIWFDTDDGNKVYVWNGSAWTNAQDAAISAAQTSANGKNTIFYQTAAPATTGRTTGDTWFDTDDGNKIYVWNGSAWTASQDAAIAAAQTTANSKVKTFVQGTSPTATTTGDIWIDTANGNVIKVWDGSAWVNRADTAIAAAQSTANAAQTSANGKNKIYYQTSMPTGGTYIAGDTWFDTDDGNKIYVHNGTTFTASQLGTNAIANLAITDAQIANTTITNAKIANLDAAKITTGTLAADRIGANTIAAHKIFVGDLTNLAADGNFTDTTKANWVGTGSVTVSAGGPNLLQVTTAASGNNDQANRNLVQVTAGEQIYGEVWVYGAPTNVGGGQPNMHLVLTDNNGTSSWPSFGSTTRAATSGTWVKVSGSITIPSNIKTAKVEIAVTYSADAVGNVYYFKEVVVRRKASGNLIVDGAIQAGSAIIGTGAIGTAQIGNLAVGTAQIADTAITTAKIANLAVTDAQIASATITSAKIANLDAAKITTGTLDANRIGADSITASHIASDAVTVNELAANSITASKGQISDLAVTTAKIANAAITSAKIEDLAVTDAKIANATISNAKIANLDAAKITTGTLDAGRIGADSITSSHIAADSITSTELAAGSITAAKGQISDLAVGTAKIADTAITTAKIANLAVTDAQIANTTITNAKIANLDAAKITTGTLDANRIGANTVTASKIAITDFNNLFDNGRFDIGADGLTGWNSGSGTVVTDTGAASGKAFRIDGLTGGYPARYQTRDIPCAPGEKIRVKGQVKRSSTANSTASVRTMFLDSAKASLSNVGVGVSFPAADTWVPLNGITTAPAGTAYVRLWVEYSGLTGSYAYVTSLEAYRMNAGELIVDGTITASSAIIADLAIGTAKIADTAITTAKIANLAVTDAQIANTTITNAKIANLDAAKITTGTLDAGRIGANTITADHIAANAITADELAANSITAAKGQISDLAVTTAKINNAAITSAKIEDLAVTDAKIANVTITNAKIANLDAAKITTGTLDAGRIGADTIDASKLNVTLGGLNLIANSSFEVDSDANGLADSWLVTTRSTGDAGRVFTNSRVTGHFPGSTWAQKVVTTTATNTNSSSLQGNQLFPISPGVQVTVSLYARANSNQNFAIGMRCEDDAAAYIGEPTFTAALTTTAQRFSETLTIPAGTTKARFTITGPTSPANGSWFEVDGVKVEIGDVVSAWSPMTQELLPGTIVANMISATAIDGKTITGALVQSESTANRGIKLSSAELAGYDGAGVKNFSLTSAGVLTLKGAIESGSTITGATVTGGTVTGSTVQTETTASRGIKLTSSELAGYDGTGVKNFSLTSAGALTLKGAIQSGSTITGAAVSGGTVTGSTIQTEATTDRGIKLTSTELSGFDGAGIKNLSLTSAGALTLRGEIKSGSTIEGARITGTQGLETSTVANTGVKINNVGIKAYDAGNNLTFHLDATTGMLEVPGLKANAITGDKLAADIITAKHLAIGDFTNVAYGGEFNSPEEFANWSPNNSTITYTTSAPQAGAGCMSVTAHASQRAATLGIPIAVQPGDKFNIEFYYKTTSDYNGTGSNAKFRVGDQANAHLQSTTYGTVQTSWTKVTNVYEVPSSGVTALTLSLNFDHTVGTVWIDSLTMRKQVGSTLIQDGSITTTKIISSGIDGGAITAGTLTSTQIKAKSILADDLVISSTDNLVVEADFGNLGTSWDLTPANKTIMSDRGRGSLPALRISGSTSEITSKNLANRISVDQTNRYRATIWVKSTEALVAGKVKMYLRCYTTATAYTDIVAVSNPATLVVDTWTKVSGMVPELPAGTLDVEVIVAAQNGNTSTWTEMDYVSLTRAMDAQLVVDGSITADSIAADSITASELAANSITAAKGQISDLAVTTAKINNAAITSAKIEDLAVTSAKIEDLAVTTAKINNAAITSAKIEDLAVTDAKIANATITNAKISNLDAAKITSGFIDAGRIDASTITATHLTSTAIDGKTITGATIQTEATTDRGLKLTSAGLTAYTSTGATAFTLSASTGRATMSGRVTTGLPGEAGSVVLPASESSSLTTSGLFISRTGTLVGGVTAGVFVADATSTSPQNLLLRGHENGHVEVETGHMYIRGANTRVGNFSNWALGDAANGSNYLPNLMIQPASGTGYLRLVNAPTSSSAANAIIAVTPEGVVYRSTSSIKYKADVQDWNADYRALGLRPRSWVDRNPIDPSMPMNRYFGYIAEEVEEVMPEFVTYDEFGDPESVTYDRMPSPATIAILKDIVRRLDEAGL